MTNGQVDRMGPALIGGLVGGIASGIPCVGALNCVCCSLYILGGGIAGMMFAKNAAKVGIFPSAGAGAIVGGLAGLIGGLIAGLLSAVFGAAANAMGWSGGGMQDISEIPNIDPEVAEQLQGVMEWLSGPPTLGGVLLSVVVSVVVGGIFGAIGGIIGNAIFRKPPVQAPPAASPPAPSVN
ncbi:MAG: hypothetical protein OEQ13_13855 [Acidobacteriota bacterium]|nr:hypothetical protein [Acidobacteriota bacterium]